jgi:hypothetical protein
MRGPSSLLPITYVNGMEVANCNIHESERMTPVQYRARKQASD